MKKILFLLFPLVIFAQSFLISNVKLPKITVLNLDPYECDKLCLQNYLDNEQIFSFLAHSDHELNDPSLDRARATNLSLLNIGLKKKNHDILHIALLLPYKKIGKYASSTTNASFAYLIAKQYPFELKSYRVESESSEDLQNAIYQIQEDGFEYIIAPLTQVGAKNIVDINPSINIYFPTIHKKDITSNSEFLYFGAIDYQAQTDLLMKEAVSPLIIFSDKSALGQKLALNEEDTFKYEDVTSNFGESQKKLKRNHKVIKYSIPRKTTNLEWYLKKNKRINNGSFFLNTPVVKSGMVMSQLTLYDANATNLLSTQINYNPLILSMTQYEDRKNMIIANSIIEHNDKLIEANALLDNDIIYDWINYTTTVGIDYFFSLLTGENRSYNIPMQENQLIYSTELIKPSGSKFTKYYSTKE